MTRYKLLVEMVGRRFEHSVFGFGFRKSAIETGAPYDVVVLAVEDAAAYGLVPDEEYREALQYFGSGEARSIEEFPTRPDADRSDRRGTRGLAS